MISIEKINANIIAQIKQIYPDIEFTAQEKLEEIVRPAFKLILDEIKSERYTIGAVKRTFPVELVYFAENIQRPKIECLGVYEKLEPTLFMLCDNIEVSVNSGDAVLIVDFEVPEIGGLWDDDFTFNGEDNDSNEDACLEGGSRESMEFLDYTEEIN